jgi:hypothetical protein
MSIEKLFLSFREIDKRKIIQYSLKTISSMLYTYRPRRRRRCISSRCWRKF